MMGLSYVITLRIPDKFSYSTGCLLKDTLDGLIIYGDETFDVHGRLDSPIQSAQE